MSVAQRRGSEVGRRRLAHLRLRAQRLVGTPASSPVEAVRWMLGMQGQDYPGVRWSVALRTADATEADVVAALDAGAIVRSWPLRGTLHLVAAEDLSWLLELTTARAVASAAARRAVLGITEAEIERARELAIDALPGRTTLTRRDLLAAIDAGGVSISGQRGYHLLWYLAQTGTLLLGPTEGSQQTFGRIDAWIPAVRPRERDEALGELATRYFRSHGPADADDLARWAGLTLSEVRRGIAIAGGALSELEVDGRRYVVAAEAVDEADAAGQAGAAEGCVLLLPGFDEYILGYRDRSAVLDPAHAETIVPGGNGMFRSTIVIDGEVAGTWSRRVGARGVVVEPEPFEPLAPRDLPAIDNPAERYGRFLGRTVQVRA